MVGRQRGGGLDAGDGLFAFAGEGAEVAFHLDAVPEGVGLSEEGTEADGHRRSDGEFAEHDLVDGAQRHADGAGHGVLGNFGMADSIRRHITRRSRCGR